MLTDAVIEEAPGFAALGFAAFTTKRAAGDFGLTSSTEPSAAVFNRWLSLGDSAGLAPERIACAHQVHGADVLVHSSDWRGFLRHAEADGHFTRTPRTLMAVTLADCVPVFIGHPSGACAVLHSGWKGTVANIMRAGIHQFVLHGLSPSDLTVHCGPAICGRCYQVGPEVYARLTGSVVDAPTTVDLRAIIAGQAAFAGARSVSVSDKCSRCNNEQFFSHRCGDTGRMVGAICPL